MGGEAKKLPQIDFSVVDPSAPGGGAWMKARDKVMDALATFGCFEALYPALTPQLRAELFDGAVRPLFALPTDAKRRNYYGADKPFHGYLGDIPGFPGYEGLAIVDGTKDESVRDFARLMWPDAGDNNDAFCGAVGAAARRIFELEEAVRRMVMEGLGVAKHQDALSASMWHLFRMAEYKAPNAAEKVVRYGAHRIPTGSASSASTRWPGWRCRAGTATGSSSSRRARPWFSWSVTLSGHGQTTVCTLHSTGSLSLGMSPDTPQCCSRYPTSRFRWQMRWWTTNTLPVSSPMTTRTSSTSVFPKKALATKIN